MSVIDQQIGELLREPAPDLCSCGKSLAEASGRRRRTRWCSWRYQNLHKAYGITEIDFSNIVERQGGVCAGCKGELRSGTGGAAVDHCHETGKVRGVLCCTCNLALGSAKDSPETLRRLADYLEASREAA